MLRSLVEKLVCPTCDSREHVLMAHAFAEGEAGHIRDGVLACPACGAWYPIEDDLLELVVAKLLDADDLSRFRTRFHQELATLGLLGDGPPAPSEVENADYSAQLKQREHFDWYADTSAQSYFDYQETPFWQAADEATFKRWKTSITPGSWLLDVGCANGRSAFPFVGPDLTVVGFDISKKQVRQAVKRAREAGAAATTTFFVADGSRLPFRDQIWDYVLIYGVLHHLPGPGTICRDVPRILKPGGIYFGSENNKSLFRGLFDLLMKVVPLWTEEAGEEPLLSRKMVTGWFEGVPVQVEYTTSVFLPPHLFNLVGRRIARVLLPATDWVCTRTPGLKHHGGLLVFEVRKPLAA